MNSKTCNTKPKYNIVQKSLPFLIESGGNGIKLRKFLHDFVISRNEESQQR
jgi:hypothetical protein